MELMQSQQTHQQKLNQANEAAQLKALTQQRNQGI
jgi:hypothetical protein